MPTYDIKNVETGEEQEVICSYSSLQEKIASGEWIQVHKGAVTLARDVGEGPLGKTSDGYKDLLKNIKRHSGRGNTIKT